MADSIPGVLQRIRDTGLPVHIILVDDGSNDDLQSIFSAYPTDSFLSFELIRHEFNLGYGAAQKTLFAAFKKKAKLPSDILILVHGDGQMKETEIENFVHRFRSEETDAVLGSRMLSSFKKQREGGRAAFKIVFDHLIRFVFNRTFYLNYSTYASGYRAYTKRCLDEADFSNTYDHHAFDTEILLILGRYGFRYSEIPVSTVPTEDTKKSKAKWIEYGWETLKLYWKYMKR